MKTRAVITGATGMVGEGVLHECLLDPDVESVLVVGRRPCGYSAPKLAEIVVPDLFDLRGIEDRLQGWNACFFCLGASSVGMDEAAYARLTYELTLNFARTLARRSPDAAFCYVSGASTDSTEKGRVMWARVKGRTENGVRGLFKNAYAFRPAYMQPTAGLRRALKYYAYVSWAYPLLRRLFPGSVTTLRELGLAMIRAAREGFDGPVVEVPDIVRLAAAEEAQRRPS
jgi:uncharacterized protein YbjT (DUF2867 family)